MFRLNGRSDVDIVLFPVKRLCYARRLRSARRALGALLVAPMVTACGYQSVYGRDSQEALCVRAAPPKVPDFGAVAAALAGARSELARAGALRGGTSPPCLVVEVLRVEETPTGISSPPARLSAGTNAALQPRSRGSSVSVTGRGWVEYAEGTVYRDTGDLNRVARVAAGAALPDDVAVHRAATRTAAENLGRGIARRVLGLPGPSRELP